MYLPRHYESKSRKNSNVGLYLLILIFLILLGTLIYFRSQILLYFSEDWKQKVSKLEQQIAESPSKENTTRYQAYIQDTLQTHPLEPELLYREAKINFNKLKESGLILDANTLIQFTYLEKEDVFSENPKLEDIAEDMFRTALVAESIGREYKEKEENKVLIYLYEALTGRKKYNYLLTNISFIEKEKLSPEMSMVNEWLLVLTSTFGGNAEALEENINLINSKKAEAFSEREINYLKGFAYYQGNNYTKALGYLRNSKASLDKLTIQSARLEAKIFMKQNLHDKAIAILENLYEETGKSNQFILAQIDSVVKDKPGFKSKYLAEKK